MPVAVGGLSRQKAEFLYPVPLYLRPFFPVHAAGLDTIVFEYWRFSGFDQPGAPSAIIRSIQVNPDGADVPTDIETPSLQGRSGEASKLLRDGQLFILRDGVIYNAQGVRVE